MAKYWIANNPNSEVTDAEAQKVEELSATGVTLAELNLNDDMVASVSFTVGSESTEAITVSCQFKDAAGADMTSARCLRGYLSADSAGQTAAASDAVRMDGTTQGGIIGDRVEFIDVGTNLWHVNVWNSATGTEASPFEALVS